MKCVLLDDELPGLAYLKMLCGQIEGLEVVKAFDDPEKLLADAATLDFDLCITDIQMPGLDGLSLASALSGKMVIFITAHKEYAVDAFDLDAVDYLTKPVKRDRLEKAVQKAMAKFSSQKTEKSNTGFLQVNTDKGRAILHFDRILLISTSGIDSRDKEVLLNDGSRMVLKNVNFSFLVAELPQAAFCRVNRREIVGLRNVQFFSRDSVTLTNGHTIALTETFANDFLSRVGNGFIT